MSLIEEALRRAQEANPIPERREILPPAPPPSQSQPRRPVIRVQGSSSRRSRSWRETALLGGGVALIAGVVVWQLRSDVSPPAPTTIRSLAATARNTSPRVVQTSPSPASHKPLLSSRPELSGIVWGPGESLAIINGNIMRVGETVDGTTLLGVRNDSAQIRWRDQELVLRTSR